MNATLSDCAIEQQHAGVGFLWAEGFKPTEMHRRMLTPYESRTMNQRKIYEWVELFNAGRTSVTKERWSINIAHGRTHPQADALIKEDDRNTLAQVAAILGISYGSAQAILHDDSRYCKFCARWMFPYKQAVNA